MFPDDKVWNEVNYRRNKRMVEPFDYNFATPGGWRLAHNQRKKPIRRQNRKKPA